MFDLFVAEISQLFKDNTISFHVFSKVLRLHPCDICRLKESMFKRIAESLDFVLHRSVEAGIQKI